MPQKRYRPEEIIAKLRTHSYSFDTLDQMFGRRYRRWNSPERRRARVRSDGRVPRP